VFFRDEVALAADAAVASGLLDAGADDAVAVGVEVAEDEGDGVEFVGEAVELGAEAVEGEGAGLGGRVLACAADRWLEALGAWCAGVVHLGEEAASGGGKLDFEAFELADAGVDGAVDADVAHAGLLLRTGYMVSMWATCSASCL